MDPVFKDLEKLIPLSEREGEAWFEIFESEIDTTLERLLLAVPTGLLIVSNKRLERRGAAVFYRGRCVGCSYYGPENRSWTVLQEAILQLELDLRAPDTVIGLSHLSIPFAVAIAAIHLGRSVACPVLMDPSSFVTETSRFLEDHNGSATLVAVDGERVISLTCYFKGTRIRDYFFESGALVSSDANSLKQRLTDEKVQLKAFIHVIDNLLDGFGIPLINPRIGGDDEPNMIGARKRNPKPDGESSIALELPKYNESDESQV